MLIVYMRTLAEIRLKAMTLYRQKAKGFTCAKRDKLGMRGSDFTSAGV
jgi:hypothetical protein